MRTILFVFVVLYVLFIVVPTSSASQALRVVHVVTALCDNVN